MDFVPERSVLDMDKIYVDQDVMNLIKSLDFGNVPGVVVEDPSYKTGDQKGRKKMDRKGDRPPRKNFNNKRKEKGDKTSAPAGAPAAAPSAAPAADS